MRTWQIKFAPNKSRNKSQAFKKATEVSQYLERARVKGITDLPYFKINLQNCDPYVELSTDVLELCMSWQDKIFGFTLRSYAADSLREDLCMESLTYLKVLH